MSKIARRIGIALVFVLGLGYFLFSNLVYDPFEGSWLDQFEGEPDVAIEYAIPREVDWMFHKRGLAGDFRESEFPVPDLAESIRVRKDFRRFAETEYAAKLAAELQLKERIEQAREAIANVPVIDVVSDVLGTDFAAFGRVKGFGYDRDETAAVFLGSRSMRFAYAAAMNSFLRSVLGLSVEVSETDEGVTRIATPDGQEFYTHRVKDLFVVGSGPKLVKEVMDLLDANIDQSLGRSRGYYSTVAHDVKNFAGLRELPSNEGPSVDRRTQLHARMPAVFSLTDADERFLEPMGEVSRWLFARLFNPRYFTALSVDFAMEDAIELKGTLGFDREMAENAKTGFYNRPTFELKKAMDRAARVLPDDTAFVLAARVDIKRFFPQIIDGLREVDPHAIELIDDVIKSVRKIRPDFRAANAADAMRNFADFLGDDVVVAVKRDTYFGVPDHPLPLIAFFFEVTERGPTFDELKKANGDPAKARGYNGFVYPIRTAHTSIRAQGASIANWFSVTHGGVAAADGTTPNARFVEEVILSGTTDIKSVSFGIVDPVSKKEGPWTMVLALSPHVETRSVTKDGKTTSEPYGTAQELISDVISLDGHAGEGPLTRLDSSKTNQRTIRRLLTADNYRQGSGFLDRFASVAMYVEASRLKEILADGSERHADEASAIDWEVETARLSEELMSGEFAQWRGKTMPDKTKKEFESRLLAAKEEIEQDRLRNVVPRLRAEYEEGLAWVDLFEDAFLAARIDDKDQIIELGARIRTSLK